MNLTINVLNTSVYPSTGTLLGAPGTDIVVNGLTIPNVNTTTQVVTNNTVATIQITKSGYHTYTNTINVFDYDLEIEIFLVPIITNPVDGNYQRPYTYFNKYIKPCSYEVYCIDASSFPAASYNYYLDRNVVATSRNTILNFLCPSDMQLGFEKVTNYNNLSSQVWWDEYFINTNQTTYILGVNNQSQTALFNNDTASNLTVEEYKPSVTLSIEVEGNACAGGDCDCIPQDSTINITPNVVLNLNNQTTPTCAESTLTYELYNYDGGLVDSQEFIIDNTLPVDNSALVYTTTLSLIGDYTLKVILENCCAICEINQILHMCNYIKIAETSCHVYTITNCSDLSSNDSIVTVTDLDNNVLTGYDDVALAAGGSLVLNTPSDGLYIVIVKDSTGETIIEQFVVIDICDVTNCLQTKIQELLCDCDCKKNTVDCTDYCKKRYELNAIEALSFSLFNKINKEYSLNSIYTTFDASKLAELFTMEDYIDRINSYCGCTGNTSGNGLSVFTTSTNSDCGCS